MAEWVLTRCVLFIYRLGHPWMCFHRPRFLQLLYESLPDREARVSSGKALDTIETTPSGVRVTCKDGSVHDGSMVVGADGVNSAVRRHLAKTLSDEKLADPFTTAYLGLFGWAKWEKEWPESTLREVHGDRYTIQVIPGKGMLMFLAYQRLPAETKGSVRCSEEQKEEIAKEIADINVAESLKFKDVWEATEWSFCSGLEEGLAEKWYGDRVVLVGDTVHKMTPNIGLGLNSGWQSAAILTNGLRRLLQKDPEPSTEALNSVFRGYQDIRKKDASDTVGISGLYTRVVAWNNPVWKFADQYVTKHIGGDCKLLDLLMIPMVKKGYTLDFLNEDNFKSGTTAWTRGRTMVATEPAGAETENKIPAMAVADVEVAA